jgi:LmbE family N-acetylglucosaminyl deacetylase
MQRVLVVSPHPDDEAIGCGGTLLQHRAEGDHVSVVFLTSGERGGHGRGAHETARLREEEAANAAGILGVAAYEFWRVPDGDIRITGELIARLQSVMQRAGAELLYVPHDAEMHADHQAAAQLVRQATINMPAGQRPKVRMFEVWTPLQTMDEIVDISAYVEGKRAAVRAYKSQCDVLRFDEAIAGLNRYRGEMHSWPGGDYAEIFLRMKW